ncbi:DUF5700 domain-containing putative Zn-dependent protease [Bacillus sp. 31A1R]|uniref:DUF5700 domain-containing putative Zn-dependent protease n=1 Tax=Robertmurraya mangrovi TaxID=3098077 RepID=A0ABU5J0I4_9BACI|nr:DUF5700 domain-containing putative Zn-dependent protease [Bacillus sp. 31A1R]MDZ5472935.1 DUF5700 domain-containing putative Zn-dependent protease [Bacillus sp. 31A1R]
MKIHNTVPYFLENYQPTVQFLQSYHDRFQPHFKEYFLYHCKNVDEKMRYAIQQYPSKISEIKKSNEIIETLIYQVASSYEEKYKVEFEKDVHVIVGCYGSNAFTHRQIIPEITFCLEKLSSKEHHLKVIIAHEFGHALHHILTDQLGIEWSELQWSHPFVWLLQEGSATYLSRQISEADESVYFTYDSGGSEWLRFAETNTQKIVSSFMEDFKKQSNQDLFLEWFSINGGKRYGLQRLGYYIGYIVLESLIKKYGELKAITLWKEPSFIEEVMEVLLELTNK